MMGSCQRVTFTSSPSTVSSCNFLDDCRRRARGATAGYRYNIHNIAICIARHAAVCDALSRLRVTARRAHRCRTRLPKIRDFVLCRFHAVQRFAQTRWSPYATSCAGSVSFTYLVHASERARAVAPVGTSGDAAARLGAVGAPARGRADAAPVRRSFPNVG